MRRSYKTITKIILRRHELFVQYKTLLNGYYMKTVTVLTERSHIQQAHIKTDQHSKSYLSFEIALKTPFWKNYSKI